MTQKQYDKLAIGDFTYLYPSTKQREGTAGIVIDIDQNGGQDEPHIWVETLTGDEIHYDYGKIGSGGPPRPATGTAIVKVLFDPEIWVASGRLTGKPPVKDQHRRWKISAVAGVADRVNDFRWALVEDEWSGRQHWLPKNEEYSFSVIEGGTSYTICLEGIPAGL
jgi:hypothetical protein